MATLGEQYDAVIAALDEYDQFLRRLAFRGPMLLLRPIKLGRALAALEVIPQMQVVGEGCECSRDGQRRCSC